MIFRSIGKLTFGTTNVVLISDFYLTPYPLLGMGQYMSHKDFEVETCVPLLLGFGGGINVSHLYCNILVSDNSAFSVVTRHKLIFPMDRVS